MKRLGVNIDHIATVRNARGEKYPDPYRAALIAMNSGADSVTIHLREDRRHIKDKDLIKIKRNKKIKLNLEMAPTNEMLKIALKNKPNYVCLVPEKRNEITTEGGLNIKKDFYKIKKIIKILNNAKIRTSLFINPKYKDIKLSYFAGAECVELHTGRFCKLFNEKKNYNKELKNLKNIANFASLYSLEVHAGHGLTYESAKLISKIEIISELNIGHFIISESIFNGIIKVIKKFKKIIN